MYEDKLREVAEQQGWNEHTRMFILIDFLNEAAPDKIKEFEEKINNIAEFENTYNETISIG